MPDPYVAPPVPDIQGREIGRAGFLLRSTPAHVQALYAALATLDDQSKTEPDLRKFLGVLRELEQFATHMRTVIGEWHALAHAMMGEEKQIDLGPGLGLVEKATSSTVKWDNDAVFSLLSQRVPVAVDPETGEATLDGCEFVRLIRESAQVAYWRKGKLKELGIPVDEVSSTQWGARRVRMKSQEGR